MTSALTPAYRVAGFDVTAEQADDMRMCMGEERKWLMNKLLDGKKLTERENSALFSDFVKRNIDNSRSSNEPFRQRMLAVRELFHQIHRNLK